MRSEELKLVGCKDAGGSGNYALRIKNYAFAINSSLSDRRERSLLTPHSNQYTSYLLPERTQ